MPTKSIAWTTGTGNITLTYQGQGDGPISVQSDKNEGAARSQVITIETTAGTPVVTKNVTVSQAACPFPVGDVKNFSYTGSYQEIELPAGQYKLQCWGAQGGSNGTNSTYGITAKAGGKGGYSEGIITLSQKTTVRVYVGGQGSSSAGGFNGGGSTTGTSSYGNTSSEFGYSKMGGGGGATDIRLSDGALLSRMIVAGGGSGGAMCYKFVTTTNTTNVWPSNSTSTKNIWPSSGWVNGTIYGGGEEVASSNRCRSVFVDASDGTSLYVSVNSGWKIEVDYYTTDSNGNPVWDSNSGWISSSTTISLPGKTHGYLKFLFAKTDNSNVSPSQYSSVGSVTMTYSLYWTNGNIKNGVMSYNGVRGRTKDYIDINGSSSISVSVNSGCRIWVNYYNSSYSWITEDTVTTSGSYTPPSNARYILILYGYSPDNYVNLANSNSIGSVSKVTTSTSSSTNSQVGYVGGGTTGDGYADSYKGKQNAAGLDGSFGVGADQEVSNKRYCSGAGGGGWYGGGRNWSNSNTNMTKASGGGSGFVNTAASAGNRPSGYTGLQLDSGETKAGNTTFKSPSGTNETGHAGNGYARITRLS